MSQKTHGAGPHRPKIDYLLTNSLQGQHPLLVKWSMDTKNILSEKQKECRVESRACKEQVIIGSVDTGKPTRGQRNLFSCCIDYARTFDSIPHTWLIDAHCPCRTDPKQIKFLARTTIFGTVAHHVVSVCI